MQSVISISIGAILGALIRWKLAECCNPLFPTLPLGTLSANLLGAFLMGVTLFIAVEHSFLNFDIRLGIVTGFLGSLTTLSTFAAEALNLISKQEYFWFLLLLGLHIFGSIALVALGYVFSKFFLQLVITK